MPVQKPSSSNNVKKSESVKYKYNLRPLLMALGFALLFYWFFPMYSRSVGHPEMTSGWVHFLFGFFVGIPMGVIWFGPLRERLTPVVD